MEATPHCTTEQSNQEQAGAFRRKLYTSAQQLQDDVDEWVRLYNQERPHSGKHCFGKTPWQTFQDSKAIVLARQLDRTMPTTTADAWAVSVRSSRR